MALPSKVEPPFLKKYMLSSRDGADRNYSRSRSVSASPRWVIELPTLTLFQDTLFYANT